MFLQGVSQCKAALDILLYRTDGVSKGLILRLLAENIEALNNGKTRIDHGGELAGKDHHIMRRDPGA